MSRNSSVLVWRRLLARMALIAAASVWFASTAAAEYPERPIRIIVPTGPAGTYDFVGRLLADELSKRLKQSVVVENRLGAGTIVGTQAAIAAPPDGYTLVVGGLSNIVFNMALYKKAPYDALTQLKPVAMAYRFSYVLVGAKDLPVSNVQDLVSAARARPENFTLANAGVGTGQHLTGAAFMTITGAKFLEVPYKGSSAVYPDLLSGRVSLFIDSSTAALPYVKSGQLKGLGILAGQRESQVPDVPTMREQGVRDLEIDSWIGLFAPAGTPTALVERLQREVAEMLPSLRPRFQTAGGDTLAIEPARLDGFVAAEKEKWTKIIRDAGIMLD